MMMFFLLTLFSKRLDFFLLNFIVEKKAQRGQLDYELALRDQAMVGELHKIPRYQGL